MRRADGTFAPGFPAENHLPVGTVRIRTRHKRGGVKRAWVKVAEPNKWKLRAQVVWEAQHGPMPRGTVVHHKDENTLNDAIDNLELLTKAAHLDEHRGMYLGTTVPKLIEARRSRRWSTKSETKRTGAPPKYDDAALEAARVEIARGMSPNEAAKRFGVSRTTCYRLKSGVR
jgi:hypothetical protein